MLNEFFCRIFQIVTNSQSYSKICIISQICVDKGKRTMFEENCEAACLDWN